MSGGRKSFNLLRWYSVASLLAIVPAAGLMVVSLSHYIANEIIERDAILIAQFIKSIAATESIHSQVGTPGTFALLLDKRVDPSPYGVNSESVGQGREEFLDHLRQLPDLLLGHLYARDRTIVWSTNASLIGTVDADNPELEEAFQSKVMVARGLKGSNHHKAEQLFLDSPESYFIENYIPLTGDDGEVIAVVEIYKEPKSLFRSIQRGHWLVAALTLAATALLYLVLFSVVKRAGKLLAEQEQRLVETETLVVIGEMSAAVAHGLRNPLATIRSSAELALDSDPATLRKNISSITEQVDRLSRWVRDLLVFSRPVPGDDHPVCVVTLLAECVAGYSTQFEQAGVQVEWLFGPDHNNLPKVVGNVALYNQVFQSIMANAVEAMPRGGQIRLGLRVDKVARRLSITVGDTGCGMSELNLGLAFKPFHTTKKRGLGVGLPMVRRIMERFGGAVSLTSREGVGTEVQLDFPLIA
jgi:two-component system, NtrC family, sensor histidine kinase HydH